MKPRRGFTYAGAGWSVSRFSGPRPNRYRKEPAWRRLEASVRGGSRAAVRPLLSLPLRLLITAALVGISLAVLSKEPTLRDEVAERVSACWDGAGGWLRNRPPAPEPAPAAAAPRPVVPLVTAPARGEVKPLALISDGGLFVLGADGSVWPNTAGLAADRYPIVTGAGVREVPGQMGVTLETRVDAALLRRLLAAPLADQLSEINLGDPDEIVLYTRDAAKIKLENGPHLDRDLRRLGAVLGDLRARGLSAAVIDLRYLQQAVARVRPQPRAEAGAVKGREIGTVEP